MTLISRNRKLIIGTLFIGLSLFLLYFLHLKGWLTLEQLKSNERALRSWTTNHPYWAPAVFSGVYILLTALSIPAAAGLSLVAGALFGWLWGTFLALTSATLGATLAFLISRYLLRKFVEQKFPNEIEKINKGLKQDGVRYLLTLRLVPAIPFFTINLAMGVTSMTTMDFFIYSYLGMFPGALVYVNAGQKLASIQSLSDITSTPVILSFLALGALPFLMKYLKKWLFSRNP
ncbi:MAG: TVP38/TMEM64 family protein [Bdellovibrionales bacterium]|nr:TVP38/TMEM64 family protein [Bdellovibrionales bacterium]